MYTYNGSKIRSVHGCTCVYIHACDLVEFVLLCLGHVSGGFLSGSTCEGNVIAHCLVGLRDEPQASTHPLHLLTQHHS